MKSTEFPEYGWPFIQGRGTNEGNGHIWLKNRGAFFLQSQGFERSEIKEEYQLEGTGVIDVAGVQDDGTIVAVECETTPGLTQGAIGNRTEILADGHQLFLLNEKGLYEVIGPSSHCYEFIPVEIQLTLGTRSAPRVGRWFANGRGARAAPRRRKEKRPHQEKDECHYEIREEADPRWNVTEGRIGDAMRGDHPTP